MNTSFFQLFFPKNGKKLNLSHTHLAVKNSERILEITGKMEKRKKLPSQIKFYYRLRVLAVLKFVIQVFQIEYRVRKKF